MWLMLINKLNYQKEILLRLPRLLRRCHSIPEQGSKTTFDDVMERFNLYVQSLELNEKRLKDYIGMHSLQKSTQMAEKSIQES